jgi:RNA polymerase sigma factor for flagellar operon FliA
VSTKQARPPRAGEAALWERYWADRSTENRNAVALLYGDLVTYHAERLASRTPANVERADLEADGWGGLMDAVGRFDPAVATFPTFASLRVHGAMVDGIRQRSAAPRRALARADRLGRWRQKLEHAAGRRVTDGEAAAVGGVAIEQLIGLGDEIAGQLVLEQASSLSRVKYSTDGGRDVEAIDHLADVSQPDPAESAAQRSAVDAIIRLLPGRELRVLVRLYHVDGMTMKEIGQVLDLSESRVSQMHSRAMELLRVAVSDRGWARGVDSG